MKPYSCAETAKAPLIYGAYSTLCERVAAGDGTIYGIPGHAKRVLRSLASATLREFVKWRIPLFVATLELGMSALLNEPSFQSIKMHVMGVLGI